MARNGQPLSQRRALIRAGLWAPLYLMLKPLTSLASRTPQDLEMLGKRLRIDIDEAYQKLPKGGSTRAIDKAGDITWLAVRYIPIGSSFDDAEAILRGAGFTVGPRPGPAQPGNRPDRYDVVALIDRYRSTLFVSRTNVFVFLSPKTPGDFYDGVSAIFAAFSTGYL